jgi:hypothetical protein
MKVDKSIVASFILLVVLSSLYRIIPNRPFGFAPQIAIALFSGSIVTDKKLAFLMPLFSMLLSDIIYELLYSYHISPIKGFYSGQWINYLLFCAITFIGFYIQQTKILHIVVGSIAGVIFYFFTSNFAVWVGGGLDINNLPYTKSLDGLIACIAAGIPFLKGSLLATLLFSAILFTGHKLFVAGFNKQIAIV